MNDDAPYEAEEANRQETADAEPGSVSAVFSVPSGENRPPPFLVDRPVAYHVTPAQPCPYLTDRWERKVWTPLDDRHSEFGALARGGFRRSHMVAYRPACPRCDACVPVRIRVRDFNWSKSMRRIANANDDLSGHWRRAQASAEQYVLFQRYLQARHADGEMADMGLPDFRAMIDESPLSSALAELRRDPDWGDGLDLVNRPFRPRGMSSRDRTPPPLHAACLVDRLDDGLSAVYSFFEPREPRRSLGTFIVLWLVRQAEALDLPYVYLGYWIAESRKMAYKARFRPLEGLVNGRWRDLDIKSSASQDI